MSYNRSTSSQSRWPVGLTATNKRSSSTSYPVKRGRLSWTAIQNTRRSSETIWIERGVKPVRCPARAPNCNAFAERFVRSIKEECLDRLILFGEASLRRALREYVAHYHAERNHQGVGNELLESLAMVSSFDEPIQRRERLGGMLNFYHREAA